MPEMDDALVELSSWLSENGIGHMVIGGFAVTSWGEPRFTRDLDVTVSVPGDKLGESVARICSRLDYGYVDPRVEELADALSDRNMLDWYRRLCQRWRNRRRFIADCTGAGAFSAFSAFSRNR